ncbi:hypothetical protein JCM11641_006612 [Rhodosporidiobolus odoratus]
MPTTAQETRIARSYGHHATLLTKDTVREDSECFGCLPSDSSATIHRSPAQHLGVDHNPPESSLFLRTASFLRYFNGSLTAKPAPVNQTYFQKAIHTLESVKVRAYLGDFLQEAKEAKVFEEDEETEKEMLLQPFILEAQATAGSFGDAVERATAKLYIDHGILRRMLNAAYANPITKYDLRVWVDAAGLTFVNALNEQSKLALKGVNGGRWEAGWILNRPFRVMATTRAFARFYLDQSAGPLHTELLEEVGKQVDASLPRVLSPQKEQIRTKMAKEATAGLEAINKDIKAMLTKVKDLARRMKEQADEYNAYYQAKGDYDEYVGHYSKYEQAKAEYEEEVNRLKKAAAEQDVRKAEQEGTSPPKPNKEYAVQPALDVPIEPTVVVLPDYPESLKDYNLEDEHDFTNLIGGLQCLLDWDKSLAPDSAEGVVGFWSEAVRKVDADQVPFRYPFRCDIFDEFKWETSERHVMSPRHGGWKRAEPLFATDETSFEEMCVEADSFARQSGTTSAQFHRRAAERAEALAGQEEEDDDGANRQECEKGP